MSSAIALAFGLPLAGIAYVFYRVKDVGGREPGLPPGPPTVPYFGNWNIFPKEFAQYTFTEWARKYGEIYSLKIGPATAIVLSSAAAVEELMEKQKAVTADRPPMYVTNKIADGKNMIFSRHGDDWRAQRRAADKILTPQACKAHLPIQQAEATQLMYDLLRQPNDFYNSARRYSSSVMMSILFGQRSPRYDTPATKDFFVQLHKWGQLLEPSVNLPVDVFPFHQKVPERFAAWKRLCAEIRRLQRTLFFGLLTNVEQRVARGEGNGCWMETVLSRAEEWKMDRELVGYLGVAVTECGSESTPLVVQALILALVTHPEVQRKAQEEIDRVIGGDRLPVLEDIENLPYCQAIIHEVHRWRPSTPIGAPHLCTQDLTYKGYSIPAGCVIIMNTWGIYHDPDVYENPDEFNPDRLIGNKFGTKPEARQGDKDRRNSYVFGCGQRICPGMDLATNSLRIITMRLLWGFNFSKAKDKSGQEITPDVWDFMKGVVIGPNRFKCEITPRTQRHKEIIEREFAEATEVFEKFEHELGPEDRAFVNEQRKGH